MDKMTLTDAERSKIRWSSSKRGYVPRIEFYDGPRGGRFRPVRGAARTGQRAAESEAREMFGGYRTPIRKAEVVEVDALGNVLGRTEVSR